MGFWIMIRRPLTWIGEVQGNARCECAASEQCSERP